MSAYKAQNAALSVDTSHSEGEEVVTTLPAEAMEPLGISLGSPMVSDSSVMYGAYVNTMSVGRDDPFPCFKKSRWNDQGAIKITQQYS